MRNILFSLCLAPLMLFAQDQSDALVHWTDIETAQKASKKDGKPVLVDVYDTWCGPCRMMDRNTFHDPRTVAYINAHFHPVKFNAEGPDTVTFNGRTYTNPQYDPAKKGLRNGTHQFAVAISAVNGQIACPTIVYIDKDGKVMDAVQGYMTPGQIEPLLAYFGGGVYQKEGYPQFLKSFKSQRAE